MIVSKGQVWNSGYAYIWLRSKIAEHIPSITKTIRGTVYWSYPTIDGLCSRMGCLPSSVRLPLEKTPTQEGLLVLDPYSYNCLKLGGEICLVQEYWRNYAGR